MNAPLLRVQGLTVRYGKSLAVDTIDLQVTPGECVGIVGPNGAGKSSTLKAIAGAVPVAAGTVELAGEAVQGRSTRHRLRRGLALVPEGRHVFPGLSVLDNLGAGGYASRQRDRVARVDEMLKRFPMLEEKKDTNAGLLSGGQQQVLAIARGLMSDPRCLLIDEFSLGLSPNVIAQVSALVSEVTAAGVSVLLVEQNPSIVESLCSRVYVMRERELESEFVLPAQAEELHGRVRSLI